MPSTARWARFDPRARLVIGEAEVPFTRCSVDYELNAIPRAVVTLDLGRDFNGNPSKVHRLRAQLEQRQKAEIFVHPYAMGEDAQSAKQPPDFGLPPDEIKIFSGYTDLSMFSRNRGDVQFSIQMEHWLSELNFSSIFSKSSHPANPGHLSYGALAPVGQTGTHWTDLSLAAPYATVGNITADFWGKALKPWLEHLCAQDTFLSWDPFIRGSGANSGALAALGRFGGACQQTLGLDLDVDEDIARTICTSVSLMTGDPERLAHQTLWDTLVGRFAASYLFSVVPRVDHALVVPFVPGYRVPFLTITTDEITQVERTAGLARPLRGIGIQSGIQYSTGVDMYQDVNAGARDAGIGGWYEGQKDGAIVIMQGPDWMGTLYSASRYSHQSAGGDNQPIGNAVQPGGPKKNDARNQALDRLKDKIRPFLDRYAQSVYVLEKLRGRQGVVSGPFRLDIAPGSCILFEMEGETHIAEDQFRAPFYGTVVRVSLVIDAEAPQIGTGFHVAHIRSEEENRRDQTSVAKHPLYRETFSGCSLANYNRGG
jgi:hypothetical protein